MDVWSCNPPPKENETWTDVLNSTTNDYDLALDWWSRTTERMYQGFIYPEPWYDTSLIMVQNTKVESELDFGELKSFSMSVWFIITLTILITAAEYYLMHKI